MLGECKDNLTDVERWAWNVAMGQAGGLSPRESQVHQLSREGRTAREIGLALGISHNTVKVHREHIRQNLARQGAKLRHGTNQT